MLRETTMDNNGDKHTSNLLTNCKELYGEMNRKELVWDDGHEEDGEDEEKHLDEFLLIVMKT